MRWFSALMLLAASLQGQTQTWTALNGGTSNTLTGVHFLTDTQGWIAGEKPDPHAPPSMAEWIGRRSRLQRLRPAATSFMPSRQHPLGRRIRRGNSDH